MAVGEDDSGDEHYDGKQKIDNNENFEQNTNDNEDSEQNISDNEDSEQRENISDSENSEQNMENISALSDEDSELDDNEDISLEVTNKANMKSKSYPTNDKDKIENKELSDASEQSDDSKYLWEDIYGRQRDKEGNIISKRYIPLAARLTRTDISLDNEKTRKLERQLKGVLNRLAEQNMHTIAHQVILLFKCI